MDKRLPVWIARWREAFRLDAVLSFGPFTISVDLHTWGFYGIREPGHSELCLGPVCVSYSYQFDWKKAIEDQEAAEAAKRE